MPIDYENLELLHEDDFSTLDNWHHEGTGSIAPGPEGGMRLHCHGSTQGREGCMAFYRPTLPDQVAIEYDITTRSTGGLVINYLAIRGIAGEDLITDRDKLPARQGIMRDYWAKEQGLQSYHVSFSRFNDKGQHTGTANWRRNPGCMLVGHGNDPVTQIGRAFRIRVTKDRGLLQLYADGQFAMAAADWATQWMPIPDHGKFGFRLIGSDVMADVSRFRVFRINQPRERYLLADSSIFEAAGQGQQAVDA